jgi:hypothetical protein
MNIISDIVEMTMTYEGYWVDRNDEFMQEILEFVKKIYLIQLEFYDSFNEILENNQIRYQNLFRRHIEGEVSTELLMETRQQLFLTSNAIKAIFS